MTERAPSGFSRCADRSSLIHDSHSAAQCRTNQGIEHRNPRIAALGDPASTRSWWR